MASLMFARASGVASVPSTKRAGSPGMSFTIKNVMSDTLVYKAVRSGISVLSAHTNLDIADGGVNTALFAAIGVNNYRTSEADPFLKIAEIEPISSDELIKKISISLNANVMHNKVKKTVKKLAICSGAGSSDMCFAIDEGADAFLTGEAKYHKFIEADTNDILLLSAGHYETENVVVPVLAKRIAERFPEIEVIITKTENPVKYYGK